MRLDSTGKRKVEEILAAKAFFKAQFPQWAGETDVPDTIVQTQLLNLAHIDAVATETLPKQSMANLCLRCFISNQIEQVCIQLESRFGAEHGFSRYDLFPFVLDDIGDIQSSVPRDEGKAYTSLATEILRTFDPRRASLSTWVSRLVKHHRDLNNFFLEHGIYMVSDWAILNDTSSQQLQKILREFHGFTEQEIQKATVLLECYHSVYRRDRRLQRQQVGTGTCPTPTQEQRQRISDLIKQKSARSLSSEAIMAQLQTLSQQLRQYRIAARGGIPVTQSTDVPEVKLAIEEQQIRSNAVDNNEDEQEEFLEAYRQQFISCLDQAIARVTAHRLFQFESKSEQNTNQYLTALYLFHCKGASMGEIAPQVGLKAQYQVSRLLKLKELRADIRQEMLLSLKQWIVEKGNIYINFEQLKALEQRVETALDQQITGVIAAAEAEANIPKNRPIDSLFTKRLCLHLDTRRGEL